MVPAAVLKPTSGTSGATRDLYGFEVKQEYVELFRRYAPLWEAEEVERQERWNAFLVHNDDSPASPARKHSVSPGATASSGKVQTILDKWLEADVSPELLEQQYQLRSLVQAGIPMSLRGTLWKRFLGLPGVAVKGEYQRLLDQVAHEPSTGEEEEGTPEESPYYIIHSSRQGQQWVQYVVESAERRSAASREESVSGGEGIGDGDVAEDASSGTQVDAAPEAVACAATTGTPESLVMGLPTPPILPLPVYPATPNSEDPPLTHPRGSCQDWSTQIEKDLHRTFPGHPVMDSFGRAALRRILCAYSLRNPSVGYCQGMNFVAGTLLLFMEEEDAFWCLTSIIENLMPGYYSLAMMAPQVDQRVFHRLIVQHFPTLATHLESLCVDASCVTSHWFLCLFVNALPLETCLRVWDVFFLERDAAVLFRVGLALVDIFSKALMRTVDGVDAMCQLQATAPMMFDGSRLMTTACIGFQDISRDILLHYRQEVKEEVFGGVKARIDAMDSAHDLEAYHYEEERFREMMDGESDFNIRNYSRDLNANTSMRKSSGAPSLDAAGEVSGPGVAGVVGVEESRGVGGSGGQSPHGSSASPTQHSTAPQSMRGGRVSRFENCPLPQLRSSDAGESKVGGFTPEHALPHTPDSSGLGLTQSPLQQLSQSPLKLLYILPEGLSRSAPASASRRRETRVRDDGEQSKAALTAFQIASTPASQSKKFLGGFQPGTMARIPSRLNPGLVGGLSRLSVTTARADDPSLAHYDDTATPRRALAFPITPPTDAGRAAEGLHIANTHFTMKSVPSTRIIVENSESNSNAVDPETPSSPASGLVTPKGRTLSGMLSAWARDLQNSEKKPTAALSPATKAINRVRELESASPSSSPRRRVDSPLRAEENSDCASNWDSFDDGNDDASVRQMLWVVENMEREVREAERLRISAEVEEAKLKQTATDLSAELQNAISILNERLLGCVELTHKVERADAELVHKDGEHRDATTMHALCCRMLSLVDSKQT